MSSWRRHVQTRQWWLMASLDAAHRGYAYQDLLVACKLVDVLLGTVVEISVDKKLFPYDLFDDLTTVDAAGRRERSQIKHTDSRRPLSLATFTGQGRGLRLDDVIASVLSDRGGPGAAASEHSYRIVLCDAVPTDHRLASVLVPAANDPGPLVAGMRSVRLAFNAEALWSQLAPQPNGRADLSGCPFAFMGDRTPPLARADLDWVCDRLVVEVQAPASSSRPDRAGRGREVAVEARPRGGRGRDVPECGPVSRRCGCDHDQRC